MTSLLPRSLDGRLRLDLTLRHLGGKLLLAAIGALATQVVGTSPLAALGIALGMIALAALLERMDWSPRWARA